MEEEKKATTKKKGDGKIKEERLEGEKHAVESET